MASAKSFVYISIKNALDHLSEIKGLYDADILVKGKAED